MRRQDSTVIIAGVATWRLLHLRPQCSEKWRRSGAVRLAGVASVAGGSVVGCVHCCCYSLASSSRTCCSRGAVLRARQLSSVIFERLGRGCWLLPSAECRRRQHNNGLNQLVHCGRWRRIQGVSSLSSTRKKSRRTSSPQLKCHSACRTLSCHANYA